MLKGVKGKSIEYPRTDILTNYTLENMKCSVIIRRRAQLLEDDNSSLKM